MVTPLSITSPQSSDDELDGSFTISPQSMENSPNNIVHATSMATVYGSGNSFSANVVVNEKKIPESESESSCCFFCCP